MKLQNKYITTKKTRPLQLRRLLLRKYYFLKLLRLPQGLKRESFIFCSLFFFIFSYVKKAQS